MTEKNENEPTKDELSDEVLEEVAGGERTARTGINPKTGKPITIAAKKVVKFKPGAELGL